MKGHANFRAVQLDNNFGIRDQAIIREADALLSTLRATEGLPKGKFDVEHFKSIHKHLLGDMYPWAGEFRKESIQVGDHYAKSVAPAALVQMETERVLNALSKEQPEGMSLPEFSNRMASYYTKLYAISPFADGNARAVRGFIDAYCEKAGMQVRWGDIPAEAFHEATRKSLQGNVEPMKKLFRSAIDFEDLADKFAVSAIHEKIADIKKKAGLEGNLVPTTMSATDDQVRKFATYAINVMRQDLQSYASGGKQTIRDWEATSIKSEGENHIQRGQSKSSILNETLARLDKPPMPKPKFPGL